MMFLPGLSPGRGAGGRTASKTESLLHEGWVLPRHCHSDAWQQEPNPETQDTWHQAGTCLRRLRISKEGPQYSLGLYRLVVKIHLPGGPGGNARCRMSPEHWKDVAP